MKPVEQIPASWLGPLLLSHNQNILVKAASLVQALAQALDRVWMDNPVFASVTQSASILPMLTDSLDVFIHPAMLQGAP